jgi:hypothetical protein
LLLLSLPLLFSLLQLLWLISFSMLLPSLLLLPLSTLLSPEVMDAYVDVDKFGGTSVAEHFTKVKE